MVSLRLETHEDASDGMRILNRFLSALSWNEGYMARIVHRSSGGARVTFGRGPQGGIRGGFNPDFLPCELTDEQALALALYREGLGTESDFYAVLSFYKVLNIRLGDGKPQKDWIRANVGKLDSNHSARAAEIQQGGNDIGEYLYVSCRCAVAHARVAPIADPDSPEDQDRLRGDRELIRGLAALYIEEELDIPSANTIIREHLYELEGFRDLLGSELLGRIKAGESVKAADFPTLPSLNIHLLGGEPVPAFAQVTAEVAKCADGKVLVHCRRPDDRCAVPLVLDFGQERLQFDPRRAQIPDDGSADAISTAMAALKMWRSLLCNAAVEVRTADGSTRLGRSEHFIGVNIDLRGTLDDIDADLQQLAAEFNRRTQSGGGGA